MIGTHGGGEGPIERPPRKPGPPEPPDKPIQPPTQPVLRRAVLHSVAPNDKNPTSCAVLLENRMPPRPGFTLPAGFGPVYAAGTTTTTINGNTVAVTGPYYNVGNKGGTFVLVDTSSNTVVQVLQGTSQAYPSSAAAAVAGHVHTGGVDANGNPMPSFVDLTNHTTGVLQGLTVNDRVVTSGLVFSYTGSSYTLSAGTIATNIISLGNTTPTVFNVQAASDTLTTDGTYTLAYLYRNTDGTQYNGAVGTGAPQLIQYSGISAANFAGTGAPLTDYQVIPLWQFVRAGGNIVSARDRRNVAGVGSTQFQTNPNPTVAPVLASALGAVTYSNVGATAYDASISSIALTTHNPTWLYGLTFYAVKKNSPPPTYTSMSWTSVSSTSATGIYYNVNFIGLTAGVQWDLYVAYEDQVGNVTPPLYLTTTSANPMQVQQGQLAVNPSPSTPPALAAGTSVAGPVYLQSGAGVYEVACTFTLAAPGSGAPWLSDIRMYAVPKDMAFAGNAIPKGDLPDTANGAYQTLMGGFAAGVQYDVYCAFIDLTNEPSAPLKLFTTSANPQFINVSALPGMPGGTVPVLSPINVFPDVNFQGTWTDGSGGALTVNQTGGPSSVPAYQYTGTGAASGVKYVRYGPFNVAANQNGFTLSAWMDPSHVTSGSPRVSLCNSDGSVIYASATATAGAAAGVVTATVWSVPSNVTTAYLQIETNNCTVASGQPLKWSQPDVFGIGNIITYPSVGSATYDAAITLALANGTTSQAWLEQIEAMVTPAGASNWTVYNTLIPNGTGAYTIPVGGLGAGTSYQLGIRLTDYQTKHSTILVLGTTSANPMQGSAVAPNTIQVANLGGTVVDNNGQLQYTVQSGQVKSVITGTGGLTINPPGGTIGTLPYANNGLAVTSTIASQPTNGTYLTQNTVTTQNIQPVNVTNSLLYSTRYSTSMANRAGNSTSNYQWYDVTGAAYLAAAATLTNGRTYTFDDGNITDSTSANAQVDTYTLPAKSSVTFIFKHSAFKTGGVSLTNIYFNGNSVSAGANVQQSTTIAGNDAPTITHTTTNTVTNDPFTANTNGMSSTATITQTANTGYNNVQHSTGNTVGSGSNASVSYTLAPTSGTATATGNLAIGTSTGFTTPGHWVGPTGDRTYVGGSSGTTYAKNLNANMGVSAHIPVTSNPPSATNPITLSYSGLASSELVGTYYTDDGSGYASDNRVANPITWTARCYNSSNTLIATVTGLTGTGSCSTGSATDPAATGSYYWTLQPQWSTNDGTANGSTWTDSGTTATASGYTGSAGQSDGNWVNFVNSGPNTVAPVDSAHQLSLTVASVTAPSDSKGSTRIDVQLRDPSGTVLQTWTGVSATTYNYSNASAVSGQYLWYYKTTVVTNTNTGSGSYAGSITANSLYYQSDAYTYYTYPSAPGSYYSISTAANTVAPTTGATQLSLAIPSVTLGSAAGNTTALGILLYDPNGNIVVNTSTTTTTAQTFTYSNVAAVAGAYTWKLYAIIANNAQNASESLAVTVPNTTYIQWYQATAHSSTVYNNNAGVSYTYTTPSTTVAPVAAASSIQLNITSATAPSNTYGDTQIAVYLKKPDGTYVTSVSDLQYSTNGGSTWNNTITDGSGNAYDYYTGTISYRYFNASAAAGVYTWIVYAFPRSNSTGDSSYNCSWSGTQTWYQAGPSGGNTYVLAADGITQRLSTTDMNVLFTSQDPSSLSFQVNNNAAQAVSFSIGVDVHGV